MPQLSTMNQTSAQSRPDWSFDDSLPLVVFPRHGAQAFSAAGSEDAISGCALALEACALRYLPRVGSILFRGFGIVERPDFARFTAELGASIRTSDATCPVMEPERAERLWLGCPSATAPEYAPSSAHTLLADTQELFRHLSRPVRERFLALGVRYARELSERSGARWQEVFGTTDRSMVEAWCRNHGVSYAWQGAHGLRIERAGSGLVRHPINGEQLWAEGASLVSYASSALTSYRHDGHDGHDAAAQSEVCFGDGTVLSRAVLSEVMDAFASCAHSVAWERGDVLLLDRLMTCARLPVGPSAAFAYAVAPLDRRAR